MKGAEELRDLTVEELEKEAEGLRQELFNLRFQHTTHQLENVMRIRQVRREIARVLTIINEKRREIA